MGAAMDTILVTVSYSAVSCILLAMVDRHMRSEGYGNLVAVYVYLTLVVVFLYLGVGIICGIGGML